MRNATKALDQMHKKIASVDSTLGACFSAIVERCLRN